MIGCALLLLLGGCDLWERDGARLTGPDIRVTCESTIGPTTVNCRR